MKKGTLSKILGYIRSYWPAIVVTLLLSLINVGLTLYIPILVGQAIDAMLGVGQVNFALVSRTLLGIGLCAGGVAVSQWIMNLLTNRITYRTVRDLRRDAFAKLQKLPLCYLDTHPQGDIVSRVIADVDQFADGLLMGFTQLFSGLATIFGTLLFMVSLQWQIALVVVCVTPVSLLVASFIARRTHDMFALQSKIRGEQTALIDEAIGEMKVVQAFGQEEATLRRFDEVNQRLKSASLRATFFSSTVNPSTRFVNSLVYAGVGVTGALSVIGQGMTVGVLTAFLSYANQYTKPFNEISGVVTELQNALACAGRVFELLETPGLPQEPEAPIPPVQGQVEIQGLSFSYDKEKPLIQNFDLSVKPGQKVAIVGPTGCGKTTFINLLMRFYDPDLGTITIDGMDTQSLTRKQLRRQFAMVLQDTWLKAGTIRENLTFGRPDATEEEIIAAAKAAHAHSFIRRLPQGYDTKLAANGGGLSQGQKQLLCIARGMLCLPPMLILDEATSSIDTRTEHKVQQAMSRMMAGRTSFVVAHRLSTIRRADVILVMENGHIVQKGTHEELLAQGGLYKTLYDSQFAH